MSGYTELRDLGIVFGAPDSPLPADGGVYSPFTAKWGDTVGLLADELRHLDAAQIAVELAITEADLRNDGIPRANARIDADAVRISFNSKHGPLRYETGEFTGRYYSGQIGWQANVRAIALGLEALRKVDRYGISRSGEQYRGWRAIPASTGNPADHISTHEQAVAFLHAQVSNQYDVTDLWDGGPGAHLRSAAREAVRRTHPDRGGDEADFLKVQKARELLGV